MYRYSALFPASVIQGRLRLLIIIAGRPSKDDKDAQIEKLKPRLDEKDAQIEKLTARLNEKDARIEKLIGRLNEKDARIGRLTAEIEQYRSGEILGFEGDPSIDEVGQKLNAAQDSPVVMPVLLLFQFRFQLFHRGSFHGLYGFCMFFAHMRSSCPCCATSS